MASSSLLDGKHFFCQGDYPDVPLYEGSPISVAQAGCGPCALSHALMALGIDATPFDVLNALNASWPDHAWFTEKGGTGNGFLDKVAQASFGLTAQTLSPVPQDSPSAQQVFDEVLHALQQTHVVILSAHGDVFHGPDGHLYVSIGHYVCLHTLTAEGHILVADSTQQKDEFGSLAGANNLYTQKDVLALVGRAIAYPWRHEVVELWR